MRQLNPEWAIKDGIINLENEHCVAWLCDSSQWEDYKVTGIAKYAIGGAPIEMWTAAYNEYVETYEVNDAKLNCGVQNEYGYGWGLNNGDLSERQTISINTSINQSKVIAWSYGQYIASPSSKGKGYTCGAAVDLVAGYSTSMDVGRCPVVSIPKI